jgi:TolA-binding protein
MSFFVSASNCIVLTRRPSLLKGRLLAVFLVWISLSSSLLADKASDDFNLAVGFYRTQRWSQAAETFDAFLKEFPAHERATLARLYLGMSLNSLEKYSPAREQLELFLQADPNGRNSAEARYRLGECSYYLKDYPKAIEQFLSYLEKHPGHSLADWAKLFLGDAYASAGEFAKAEELLIPLADGQTTQPVITDARFSLGKAMEGQKKTDEAIAVYLRVVMDKNAREAPRALIRIGSLQYSAQRFQDAAKTYDQLITEYPQGPQAAVASLGAGMSWYRAGSFENAIDRFRKVPENSSGSAQAILMTAMSLRELGRPEESRKYFADALRAAGDGPLAQDILFQQAQLERTVAEKATSAQMFEDIADRWPASPRTAECLFNAAELRLELNDRDRVERLWKRLKADFPEAASQTREQILLGRIYLLRKEPERAAEVIEKVIAASATAPVDRQQLVARYYLIRALFDLKQHAKVVEQAEQLSAAVPAGDLSELIDALALATVSCLEEKLFDTAIQYADQYLSISKDDAQKVDVSAAKAVAQVHMQQFQPAIESLQVLTTDHADDPQVWSAVLQSAEAALQIPAPEAAVSLFDLAALCETDPAVKEAGIAGKAWSHFRMKKYGEAEQAFAVLLEAFPASEDAAQNQFMKARSVEEQGDAERTAAAYAAVFESLTKDQPPAATDAELKPPGQYAFDAGQQWARGLSQLKKVEEADKAWETLVSRFPATKDMDRILDEWAWTNSSANRFDRSDEIHRRLLDQFPNSPFAGQARLSLAESLLDAGQLEPALKEMEAIVADSRYGATEKERALFHVIEIQASRGLWQLVSTAADQFLASYSSSPLAAQVKLFAGDARLQLGDAAGAKVVLTELRNQFVAGDLAAQDWTDRVWIVLAETSLALKAYDEIEGLENELLQRSPQSPFMFQMMDVQGRRWKQQAPPDFEKSRDYFRKVLSDKAAEGTQTAARCQFLLAETLVMEMKHAEAEKEYFKVYLNHQYDELRAQGLYQAAQCAVQQKKNDQAIRDFQEFLRVFPASGLVPAAQDQLKLLGVESAEPIVN